MKIWIFLDGQQQGPFSLEELLDKPVDQNTKVWFEGLPKWYPAGSLDELRPLFDGSLAHNANEINDTERQQNDADNTLSETSQLEVNNGEVSAAENTPTSKYAPGTFIRPKNLPDEPCPPTYIGWSIFLTICCCSPISLAGLVASICVSTFYNNGRIDRARKASEIAAWLIMVAIALGIIPVMLMSAFFGE
ncbi:MAG: CD225/dispanin family protein [Muribaculaceae bacterium]|nr:CD225/dispanin family protein [Muribaculaceae bacterium]